MNPIFKSSKHFQEHYDVLITIDSKDAKQKSQSLLFKNNNKDKKQEYYDYKTKAYYDIDQ